MSAQIHQMDRHPTVMPQHPRRKDAEDIADELIAKILLERQRFALFITPNREVKMCPVRAIRFQDWCQRWPTSLCGIYDDEVSKGDLIDDIEGMHGTIGRPSG